MHRPIRLVIADDHGLFRQGLKMMLQLEDIEVVGEVATMSELPATLATTTPDMLLLDLQMERSALPDIATLAKGTSILVVTANEGAEDALVALRRGVRGIVFKRFAVETLMEAIWAVADGHVWMPPELQSAVTADWREPSAMRLTEREREVVRHVALGLRNAEVAQRLGVSEVTIKTHLSSVFQKLGLRDRVELTLYAIRAGLADAERRQS
jgi:DNA-binding NarL/FixJ family response regulator